MSTVRCYIKPFNEDGTYQSDWTEITDDVMNDNLGKISSKIEGSDYDVGIFTFSNISIFLSNKSGAYSEVGDIRSIFFYRRAGSKVKLTEGFTFASFTI